MGEFQISYDELVVKQDIPNLSPDIGRRIKSSINKKLTINPAVFGKPLRSPLAGFWALRVGNYRVVYEIIEAKVIIRLIELRNVVYGLARKRLGL